MPVHYCYIDLKLPQSVFTQHLAQCPVLTETQGVYRSGPVYDVQPPMKMGIRVQVGPDCRSNGTEDDSSSGSLLSPRLLFNFFIPFICMCVLSAYVWSSENSLQESLLSFYMWVPRIKLRSLGLLASTLNHPEQAHQPPTRNSLQRCHLI